MPSHSSECRCLLCARHCAKDLRPLDSEGLILCSPSVPGHWLSFLPPQCWGHGRERHCSPSPPARPCPSIERLTGTQKLKDCPSGCMASFWRHWQVASGPLRERAWQVLSSLAFFIFLKTSVSQGCREGFRVIDPTGP